MASQYLMCCAYRPNQLSPRWHLTIGIIVAKLDCKVLVVVVVSFSWIFFEYKVLFWLFMHEINVIWHQFNKKEYVRACEGERKHERVPREHAKLYFSVISSREQSKEEKKNPLLSCKGHASNWPTNLIIATFSKSVYRSWPLFMCNKRTNKNRKYRPKHYQIKRYETVFVLFEIKDQKKE